MRRQAEIDGIPADWMDAARRSPVYALAMRYRVALPLHPEYRTLPMVWYVPPLSPVMGMIEGEGSTADPDDVFPAIDRLRIPVRYLVQPARGRRRRGDPPGAQAARRDAALHARAVAGRRGRRLGGRLGGHGRRRHGGHVPPARAGQVRRALRHPVGPRRAGRRRCRPSRARAGSTSPAAPEGAGPTAAPTAPRRRARRSTSTPRRRPPSPPPRRWRGPSPAPGGGCGGGACTCGGAEAT